MKRILKFLINNLWTLLFLLIPFQLLSQDSTSIITNAINGEETFLMYFLMGIIGILLHIISKIRLVFNDEKLTWKIFKSKPNWGSHFLYALFALLVVILAVISRNSLSELYPITYFSIAILGYGADSAFKNWSKFKYDNIEK